MAKVNLIPKRANSGVQFLGVNMGDAMPFVICFVMGLLLIRPFGPMFFFITAGIGYFITKALVLWKERNPPGAIQAWLYSKGIFGYSKVFDKQNKLFLGDNTIENFPKKQIEQKE